MYDLPQRAVGYIRVSTDKQNDNDHALTAQQEKIREFCAKRGMRLAAICEDTGSAAGMRSGESRPGLRDALAWAKHENMCLVVTEPTRLFRNVAAGQQWLRKHPVQIVSVRDGRILTESELLEVFREGENFVQSVRTGTSGAIEASPEMLTKRAASLAAAQAASRKARSDQSLQKTHEVASIMARDPAYRSLSHDALAELLNRHSVRTTRGLPWTRDGVRRQRKLAEDLLDEWAEADRDDVSGEEMFPADEADMRKLPTFGVF